MQLGGRIALVCGLLALVTVAASGFRAHNQRINLNGTRVEGVLLGDHVWTASGNPYWIESTVWVPAGSNLTIESGVSVLVNGDYSLRIGGSLLVNGSKIAPVVVSPNSSVPFWGGIKVQDGRFSARSLQVTEATVHLVNLTDTLVEDLAITNTPGTSTALQFDNMLNLTANDVTISLSGGSTAFGGFNTTGLELSNFNFSGGGGSTGIEVASCHQCVISNGIISQFLTLGIALDGDDCRVSNTRIMGSYQAITYYGNRSTVELNLITDSDFGIHVEGSDNIIANNTIIDPVSLGIDVVGSWYLTNRNLVIGNRIVGAGSIGLYLTYLPSNPTISDFNTAAYNTVESSRYGIRVESSNNNIYGKVFLGNRYGARTDGARNRIFHNHFTSNTQQALDPGLNNEWDDGYPSGGNWWSDYVGVDFLHGPGQNLPGPDGIGDTPYVIDADSKDDYPFYYMPLPLPPRHVTASVTPLMFNVILEWEEPPLLSTGQYLIYAASTPTGFDFSTPTATVLAPTTNWTDFGAAAQSGSKYYIVRAENRTSGAVSPTSNTAGKFTAFFPVGLRTFSLPLARYPWIDYSQSGWDDTAGDFLVGMRTSNLQYMDSGRWISVPGSGNPDRRLELGEGYVASFPAQAHYAFVGLPASMISFEDSPPLWYEGFDQVAARLITATPQGDDIRISWTQPPGMVPWRDTYKVYYSPRRDGFHGLEGLDFFLLNGAPVLAPWGAEASTTHTNALSSGREWYYMVVPYINSSLMGSSSYSIGVDINNVRTGYSAIGLPLRPYANGTYLSLAVSSLSSPEMRGLQWLNYSIGDWTAHAAWMPSGMHDSELDMIMAVQVDAAVPTRVVFTGV